MKKGFDPQFEGFQWEKMLVLVLSIVSLIIHVGVFFVDPSIFFKDVSPIKEEWVIETDISGFLEPEELKESKVAVSRREDKRRNRKEEEDNAKGKVEKETKQIEEKLVESKKEQKEMLPQLPKNFQIKEEDPIGTASKEIESLPIAEKKADITKKLLEEMQAKRDQESQNIAKKDAINRLLREKKRVKAKEDAKYRKLELQQKKIKSILNQRREETSDALENVAGNIEKIHPYLLLIKKKIRREFALPNIYRYEDNQVPIIFIVINDDGNIRELQIVKSSENVGLDNLVLKSVRDAAPFPHPPREIAKKPFQLRFDPKAI